jgi:probable phosphoglycerate mutase
MIKRPQKSAGRLFSEPATREERLEGAYTANIDGAARGNPGPASYAVVLRRPDGTPLESLGKHIGRQTNNVAEYYALIAVLDYALAHHLKRLRVRSDSELLVRQVQGIYKVKSPDLRPLHERARKMIAGLEAFAIEHVPREQNADADAVANAALDSTGGNSRAPVVRPAGRTIRAQFRGGVLHPLESLDLPEGATVRVRIDSGEQS